MFSSSWARILSITILVSLVVFGQWHGAQGREVGLTRRLRNRAAAAQTADDVRRRIADEEDQFAEILYQANPQYVMQDHMDAFDELLAFVFDNMSIEVTTAAPTVMRAPLVGTDAPTPSTPAPIGEDVVDLGGNPAIISPTAAPTQAATVKPTATPTVDSPPVANDNEYTTDQDNVVSDNVLTNDSDPNGDPIEVTAIDGTAVSGLPTEITLDSGAVVAINPNGDFVYDPNGQFDSLELGQSATDSFAYAISDPSGATDSATVTITITGLDEPTSSPTKSPTTAVVPAAAQLTSPPTIACGITSQVRAEAIFAILSDVSAPTLLMDPTTPQGRAYAWLVGEDELYVCPDESSSCSPVVQRYVLALMYFSTNGDGWFQCSGDPSATDDCGNEEPFMGEVRFLAPVDECQWAGIECNERQCVSEIEFELNNLVGTIPNELVNLANLEVLGMERGGLVGTIPTVLGQLTKLYFIDLDFNSLTGTIPTEISFLTNLEQLDLNNNRLTGDIESIVTLNKLFFLQLHNNMFDGTVPQQIGNFSELAAFTLHSNDLTGEIPSQVCRLRDTFGGPLVTLTADCNPPENPEINCTCCTDCRNV